MTGPPMRRLVIIGLGNLPYPKTKHSVGHLVVDSLGERFRLASWTTSKPFNSLVVQGTIPSLHPRAPPGERLELVLVKPRPLMNILGPCLKPILGAYPLSSTTSYFIVYDHLEKEEGTYQVRRGGSANGHNGMRSCITTLRDLKDEVWHVRIGIGRPSNSTSVSNYVLSSISSSQKRDLASEGVGIDNVWDTILDAVYPPPNPPPRVAKRTGRIKQPVSPLSVEQSLPSVPGQA